MPYLWAYAGRHLPHNRTGFPSWVCPSPCSGERQGPQGTREWVRGSGGCPHLGKSAPHRSMTPRSRALKVTNRVESLPPRDLRCLRLSAKADDTKCLSLKLCEWISSTPGCQCFLLGSNTNQLHRTVNLGGGRGRVTAGTLPLPGLTCLWRPFAHGLWPPDFRGWVVPKWPRVDFSGSSPSVGFCFKWVLLETAVIILALLLIAPTLPITAPTDKV